MKESSHQQLGLGVFGVEDMLHHGRIAVWSVGRAQGIDHRLAGKFRLALPEVRHCQRVDVLKAQTFQYRDDVTEARQAGVYV